jgi:hypothetical protein
MPPQRQSALELGQPKSAQEVPQRQPSEKLDLKGS